MLANSESIEVRDGQQFFKGALMVPVGSSCTPAPRKSVPDAPDAPIPAVAYYSASVWREAEAVWLWRKSNPKRKNIPWELVESWLLRICDIIPAEMRQIMLVEEALMNVDKRPQPGTDTGLPF